MFAEAKLLHLLMHISEVLQLGRESRLFRVSW